MFLLFYLVPNMILFLFVCPQECLEYTIDAGFPEAAILSKEIQESIKLSSSQISKLQVLLGRV